MAAASTTLLAIIFVLPATSFSASLSDLVKADPDVSTVDRVSQYDASRGVYYTGDSANVSRLIESLMRGYDKRLRPNYKGAPVEVGITMYVSSVSSISEINMDFTLDFYFRQHWHDERLAFSPDGSPEDELCISNEMLDKIWWPDTFFTNAKSARFHTATTKNAFLRIKPSGWITQSLRLTVTAMCPMDLRLFPMDYQVCPLEIESYAYSVKHISYRWKEGERESLNIDKSMQLPQFVIRGYKVDTKLEVLSTGNYSRLACQLLFVRSIGYYLIQIYVPSSLIVVISWVSFWLDRNATPARVALGIMTVLTLTTLISNTSASLPKISYLKSIDVYLVTCFVMVFAALLEYAAVSFIGNRKWKPKQPPGQSTTGYLALSSRKAGEKRCNASRTPDSIVDDNDRSDLTMRISSGSEVLLVGKSNPVVQDIELVASAKRSPQDQQPATKSTSLECGRGPPKYSTFSSSSQGKSPTSRTPTSTVEPAKPPPAAPVQPNMNIRTANAIDKYSRVIFPVIFVVFTVTYWVVYVNKANRDTLEGFIPV